jgi:hypothetical protein
MLVRVHAYMQDANDVNGGSDFIINGVTPDDSRDFEAQVHRTEPAEDRHQRWHRAIYDPECLCRAAQVSLSWPLPDELDDERIEALHPPEHVLVAVTRVLVRRRTNADLRWRASGDL